MRVWVAGVVLLMSMGSAHANIQKQSPVVGYTWNTPASAVASHPRGRPKHKTRRITPRVTPTGSKTLVSVPTAAGITITVARNLSDQFRGFIQDLVKDGYTPHSIRCWAPVGTHVPNSNHYHGGACDFDQTGRNRTAAKMYRVRDLAARWGLRDGCSFRDPDCGHIDDGSNVGWRFKHPNLIARYVDWKNTPLPRSKNDLTPFEE